MGFFGYSTGFAFGAGNFFFFSAESSDDDEESDPELDKEEDFCFGAFFLEGLDFSLGFDFFEIDFSLGLDFFKTDFSDGVFTDDLGETFLITFGAGFFLSEPLELELDSLLLDPELDPLPLPELELLDYFFFCSTFFFGSTSAFTF
jgi:hypothetical protein